jgi:hypothetical protein
MRQRCRNARLADRGSARGWKHSEPFKGVTADLGVPAAQAWAARELERIVSENHLDMLEHDGYLVAQGSSPSDHPAEPPDPATLRSYEDSGYWWVESSNATDVSYHATRAYYAIYEQLRRRHPTLLLEICNDGGRMVDFGSAAHGDYFSITDTYDPLSNRRAFYDASYRATARDAGELCRKLADAALENLRYMLRSGMLGWFSLMLDARQWTPEQRAAARGEFALYKNPLRPLIREADLYHVAQRPDGVIGTASSITRDIDGRACSTLFAVRHPASRSIRSCYAASMRGGAMSSYFTTAAPR